MKKGFAPLILLAVVGLLIIAGISGYVVAKNYTSLTKPRVFSFLNNQNDNTGDIPSVKPNVRIPPARIPSPTPTDKAGGEAVIPTNSTYSDPFGNYSLILPSNWLVDSTYKAATYTTTKFIGPEGSISVTVGTGKDPIGGCSENSSITLAQGTILGCFLLQKDGSQILTRGYTKTSKGSQITVEAYINPVLTINKPIILNIIKTIQVN